MGQDALKNARTKIALLAVLCIQIRSRSDPKLLTGSGSGKKFRIRKEWKSNYFEKLIKFDNFSTKMLNLKI
jgi:hypothetical protein